MLKPALALALLALASCGSTGEPAPDPIDARLLEVDWLVGTWRLPQAGGFVRETWLAPEGTSMLGAGATVKHGKTVAFEYFRIEARDDGLVFVAHPGGRSPGTEFAAVLISANEARFENPEHDFPKWIHYERLGPDACTATIGDDSDRFELAYRREGSAR